MVAHAFNSRTWEAEAGEFEASLVQCYTEKLLSTVAKSQKNKGGGRRRELTTELSSALHTCTMAYASP